MQLTTPSKIDKSVELLCKSLPDAGQPVFLDLFREHDAKVSDCFYNVERKIAREGGFIQYGWCVWYAEGVMIEGEFHAVWKSPKNELVDITPKNDGEQKILFIPDNKTKYAKEPIDNIRVPLSKSAVVKQTIAMQQRMTELKQRYNDGSGESQIPMHEVLRHVFGINRSDPGYSTKVGRNQLCPCGSGKKHKKCCG